MVTVEFAPALQRHIACPPQSVTPATLREVLAAALRAAPGLSHYVFDDQGSVRKHVAIFVNQQVVRERVHLGQPLQSGDRVLVIQALSGG